MNSINGIILNADSLAQGAAILFGSVARRTSDQYSDLDILILSGRPLKFEPNLCRGIRKQPQSGSMLHMHWDEFERIMNRSTPFARHLRTEAKIIWDPTSRASDVINSRPKISYYKVDDVDPMLKLAMKSVADGSLDYYIADLCFVSFRSHSIRLLLNHDIHAFDLEKILSGVDRINNMTGDQKTAIRTLRMAKSLYRNCASRLPPLQISWADVRSAFENCVKLYCPINDAIPHRDPTTLFNPCEDSIQNDYHHLRELEKEILIHYGSSANLDWRWCGLNIRGLHNLITMEDPVHRNWLEGICAAVMSPHYWGKARGILGEASTAEFLHRGALGEGERRG